MNSEYTNKIREVVSQHSNTPTPNEGIFFEGQIFDAWQFVARLIKDASESIVLIDNY